MGSTVKATVNYDPQWGIFTFSVSKNGNQIYHSDWDHGNGFDGSARAEAVARRLYPQATIDNIWRN